MPMYLVHTKATSLPSCKLTGAGECYIEHLRAYGDVQELNRRGSVTHLAPARKKRSCHNENGQNKYEDRRDEDRDGVNVTRHGMFCRISLKCGGVQSIIAATDEVSILFLNVLLCVHLT